ncbi:MAG: hypothetical protein WCD38_12480 [Candidatus Tumulicola sp.]
MLARYARMGFLTLALGAAAVAGALAVVGHGPVWSATYVAAYNPLWNGGVPYAGDMKLTFNHGIISGTYSAISTRPDPLYGRIINVTGTVQHGNINLDVGGMSGFTVRGTLSSNGEISGTATQKGHMYRFLAKVKSSP